MQTEDTQRWFDPADLKYKTPYGAAPSGTQVRFTLRPRRREAFVRAFLTARWEQAEDQVTLLSLPWTGLEGEYDLFSGTLELNDYVGLIWYSLALEHWDGSREETPLYQLTVYDGSEPVPSWFGEGVSYQIFPDRFHRLGIPDPAGMPGGRTVHQCWDEEPEYRPDSRGEIRNRDFFGGSLQGVEEKLPYLKSLGVETLYFCPIFEGPENHRYGTGDYEKIDPMLGTKEDFTHLCEKAHGLGMRVMLDGVFNHTAFVSRYFNGDGSYPGVGAHQSESSPYRDWFCFQHWPDQYTSWWGIYSMPTTNKQNPQWLEYITGENGIIRSWLRSGADGWRLDVADELPDSVVHAIHAAARAEKSDAVVIGEVWEDASNKIAYDVRRHHLWGRHCDGVMNYPLRNALTGFLLGGDGAWFQKELERQRQNYPRWAFYSSMNSLGTHDTLRILTLLGEESGGQGDTSRDQRCRSRLNPEQRALAVKRLKLGSLLLYAFPGSPTLYYGDEAGMEGFEDPFNRRTYPWGCEDGDLVRWFTGLGKARNGLAPLRRGELEWLRCQGRTVCFARSLDGERIVAAVNAGEKSVLLELPDGKRLRLGAMEGKLLRWSEQGLTQLLHS